MTPHTPGPWRLGKEVHLKNWIYSATGDWVAQAVDDDTARLIAAAPEMLALLERLVATVGVFHGDRAAYDVALDARTLLARIEGKE